MLNIEYQLLEIVLYTICNYLKIAEEISAITRILIMSMYKCVY